VATKSTKSIEGVSPGTLYFRALNSHGEQLEYYWRNGSKNLKKTRI